MLKIILLIILILPVLVGQTLKQYGFVICEIFFLIQAILLEQLDKGSFECAGWNDYFMSNQWFANSGSCSVFLTHGGYSFPRLQPLFLDLIGGMKMFVRSADHPCKRSMLRVN